MILPVIETPVYELILPSTKEKFSFRPFLVREEKILLIAQESENEQEMINAIKAIVKNCTFDKIDIEELPLFDIEYIFIKLRSKSVGEIQEVNILVNDKESKTKYVSVEINLAEIEVFFDEKNNKKIEVNENIGIVMKYPSISLVMKNTNELESKLLFDAIVDCIDYIYEGEEIHYSKDYKKEQLLEWIETLSDEVFMKIRDFFNTLPKLKKEIKFSYETKTGEMKKGKQVLEGLNSFFT